MLACADKNGEIQASVPGLARIAGVPVYDCRIAIGKFLSPDPDSRTKDDEGRRIEEIDGGWALLNFRKYRDMATKEDLMAAEAARKARYRAKLEGQSHLVPDVPCVSSPPLPPSSPHTPLLPPTPPPSDSDAKAQVPPVVPQGGLDKLGQKIKSAKITPNFDSIQLRLNAIFRRKPTTPWSEKELKAYRELTFDEDGLKAVENHYTTFYGIDRYLRKDLCTLLNNWNGEVDRSINYKPDDQYRQNTKPNPRNDGVCLDPEFGRKADAKIKRDSDARATSDAMAIKMDWVKLPEQQRAEDVAGG